MRKTTGSEVELLKTARRRRPRAFQRRYRELMEKRQAETLTEAEYQELLHMTAEAEAFDTRRIKALSALADLRQTDLDTLMHEFRLLDMAKSTVPRPLKRAVVERARRQCEYCRSREDYAVDPFSAEHIIPQSRGGGTDLDNLALSCQTCNNHKYNKVEGIDPQTGNLAPLFHPRQQRWSDHFAWSEDATLIVGQTPTGRATIYILDMNRESLINLRQMLHRDGKHPTHN